VCVCGVCGVCVRVRLHACAACVCVRVYIYRPHGVASNKLVQPVKDCMARWMSDVMAHVFEREGEREIWK